jgi:predicted RNA-binding protein with RPS1 domain
MGPRVGDLVEATLVEVREDGALVSWDAGEGVLPLEEVEGGLRPGQQLLLKVVSIDSQGKPVLSQRQVTVADRELFTLQREAERLRKLLRERDLIPPGKRNVPKHEPPIEERLYRWIQRSERELERLRRRRRRFGLR